MTNNFRKIVYPSIVALAPVSALAEVSDKMPTLSDHWVLAIPTAITVFLLGWYRWRLGIAFLLVPILMIAGSIYLFFIDSVGSGLIAEQGIKYLVSKVGADSFVLASCLVGIMTGRRRAAT